MSRKAWPIVATLLIAGFAVPAGAQAPREESAQQNVRESEQYEQLLCTNPAFRNRRIQQECGPIDDPQLHQQCVDSFQCRSGGGGPVRRRHHRNY
ncbi:MAG: hypothetical protein JO305_08750 [Alphaproteobacteria bacterium]|nr:hypothetical protein [Alphaproteobacteria bacterium]